MNYLFENFELREDDFSLSRDGVRLRLEPKAIQVLLILVSRAGRLVEKQSLIDQVWHESYVEENNLTRAIVMLRRELGDDSRSPRLIETVPTRGYRFIATVQAVSSEQATAPGATGDSVAATPEVIPAAASRSTRRVSGWYLGLAACLVPLAILGIWLRPRYRQADSPIRSLAVMPLEDLSPGPRDEYFADGMTDELITELAQVPGLRIVSRMSVMQEKGTHEPLAQVARELNVDALVEGSVVRSGDRVRITARLIDARIDNEVWAQSFEGPLGDVLSLQDSVAREITSQTRTALTPAARAGLTNAKPVNPEAHDDYLRGLYFINRREGVLAASYFQKAIVLEPDYAAAQAGYAEALATQFIADQGNADEMPSAIAAAKRAIELDPNCGEAYTALGAIDVAFLWDWNAAEQNLRKGIALSPSSSHAQIWLAYLTEITRPAEAVEAMRRAVALEPLSFWANRHLGATLYYARRYDESLAALKRASELAPDRPGFVGFWISADYEMQGRYADAMAADLIQFTDLSPADTDYLRSAFESGGWKGYQEARVKVLPFRPGPAAGCGQFDNIALSYLRLGKMTEAFQWFNREVDRRCAWVVLLPADPRLDKIRTDSHYTALVGRIHLPQQP